MSTFAGNRYEDWVVGQLDRANAQARAKAKAERQAALPRSAELHIEIGRMLDGQEYLRQQFLRQHVSLGDPKIRIIDATILTLESSLRFVRRHQHMVSTQG